MWTGDNRRHYHRDKVRYRTDLSDEGWTLVPLLIFSAQRGGRRRSVDAREVINGFLYMLGTGCRWRYVPMDLLPNSTR